jgi:hypothetical protein
LRRAIPRKDLVESWKDLDSNAHSLAKRLSGKEAATPSRTWQLLSSARPEMILFLAITARQQAVAQKIKNFFTKWRQVQQKIPLPEMTELRITPQMPAYPKIANDVFMLLLDGKLRSRTETLKFLKPLAPPPPPPPPPPPTKRGRGAKAAAAAAAPAAASVKTGAKGKGKVAAAAPATPAQVKSAPASKPVVAAKPAPPAKLAKPAAAAKAAKPAKAAAIKKPGKPAKPAKAAAKAKTKTKAKAKKNGK